MQDRHPTLSSYHFKRAKTDGLIEVLNEGSYVMAEDSERTGDPAGIAMAPGARHDEDQGHGYEDEDVGLSGEGPQHGRHDESHGIGCCPSAIEPKESRRHALPAWTMGN